MASLPQTSMDDHLSLRYASLLLNDGILSRAKYETLTDLIKKDIDIGVNGAPADPPPVRIPGAIALISASTSDRDRRRLDVTSKVLNIVELLEHILSHVPVKDLLLRVQRTCKQMRLVISTSKSARIQQALFRLPRSRRTFTPFPIGIPGLTIHKALHWCIHIDVDMIASSVYASQAVRSTQLGQYPVKRVTFWPRDDDEPSAPRYCEWNYSVAQALHENEIENVKGVTFGCLLDVIEKYNKPTQGWLRSVHYPIVLRFHWVLKHDEGPPLTPPR